MTMKNRETEVLSNRGSWNSVFPRVGSGYGWRIRRRREGKRERRGGGDGQDYP